MSQLKISVPHEKAMAVQRIGSTEPAACGSAKASKPRSAARRSQATARHPAGCPPALQPSENAQAAGISAICVSAGRVMIQPTSVGV